MDETHTPSDIPSELTPQLSPADTLVAGLGASGPQEELDLTEGTLRTREELLEAQAAYIDLLFGQSTVPLVLLDPDFNFLRVNQAYANACHRDITEFTGKNHFELYPSDTKTLFDEVVRTKQPMAVKRRAFQFPDHPEWGVTYWDWTLTPLVGTDGAVRALLFALEDVTDRHNRRPGRIAAGAHSAGRALFRRRWVVPTLVIGAVVEVGTMFGVDRLGSTAHYLGLPGAIAALVGVLAATISGPIVGAFVALCGGMGYFVFLTDLGASVYAAAIVLSILLWMASAAIAGFAADWVRRRGGEREHILSQTVAEREQLLAAVRDKEDAARQRAEELEKLMNLVPVGIWVSRDPQCRTVHGNQEASRMFEMGRRPAESEDGSTGEPLRAARRWFSHGRELAPGELPMELSAASGRDVLNHEMDALLPSGRRITVLGNSSPLFDDEGHVRGCLGAYLDITERKLAETDREILLHEQQELNARLSRANDELRAQRDKLRVGYQEQAHLARREHLLFERLQRVFLDSLPRLPNVDFAHAHLSATSGAQIGGDFDAVCLARDDCAGLLVGDVSGQGIEASRVALMVKDAITAYAIEGRSPDDVLTSVNDLLVKKGLRGFVTAFYGCLDLATGHLVYASAGHPPPLLWVSGVVRALEFTPAPPLGAFPGTKYSARHAVVPDDAGLLLYTDGITEARSDGILYGELRLAESLASHGFSPIAELPTQLIQDVLAFAEGSVSDDAAILIIQYRRPGRVMGPAGLEPATGRL